MDSVAYPPPDPTELTLLRLSLRCLDEYPPRLLSAVIAHFLIKSEEQLSLLFLLLTPSELRALSVGNVTLVLCDRLSPWLDLFAGKEMPSLQDAHGAHRFRSIQPQTISGTHVTRD